MKTLKGLAREIVAEHRAAERDAGKALEHARRCGELLALAKDKCQHGEWLPWLAKNCELAPRTAQAYMRLATRWDELPEAQRDALLPIRDAVRLMHETAEEAEEEDDPEQEEELRRLHAEAIEVLKDPASTARQQEEAVAKAEQAEAAAAGRRHERERQDGEKAGCERMAELVERALKIGKGLHTITETTLALGRQFLDSIQADRENAV